MNRIKTILKRNVSAIVFFSLLGFAVLSYVDDRNLKIEQIENLTTFVNGSLVLIDENYNFTSNKSYIADDIPQSYDDTIADIDELIVEVAGIKDVVPNEGLKIESYKNTKEELEVYLSATIENLEVLSQRYEMEKEILDQKPKYYELRENPEQIKTREDFEKFLDIYLEVANFQSWYFEMSDQGDDSSLNRVNELIDELNKLKSSDLTTVNYPQKAKEIIDKSGYFSYTKLFRIIQSRDLESPDYLESLQKVQENLKFLRKEFNLEPETEK